MTKRKIFVSYHHGRDQQYANQLREFYSNTDTIIDRSLPEAFDSNDNDYILSRIRQDHLKDSTVTIVLIGAETWARKWVDWEIYSSLRPYRDRTVNGLLGILLPTATKLPPRLEANYKFEQIYWGLLPVQTGYARLIKWEDIAPPYGWPYFDFVGGKKQQDTLAFWIEQAFNNRSKTHLINNTLDRYKSNRPILPSPLNYR